MTTGPALVRRFNRGELALHWMLVVDVVVLALTGLGLYLPVGHNPVLGHRELMRTVHIDAGVAMFAILPIVASASPRTLTRLWRDVEWFDRDDWRWLRRVVVPPRLRPGRCLPAPGRFNAGQKLNTIAIAAAMAGFAATGVLMDLGGRLPPGLAEAADTWHIWLMLLIAPLVAGHLLLATVIPATRPALRGILTGRVRLEFARSRHGRWAATVAPEAAPPTRAAPTADDAPPAPG